MNTGHVQGRNPHPEGWGGGQGNGSLLPGSSHCARSIGSGFTNYHVEGGWDYTGDGLPDLLAKHRTGGALRPYRHPGVPGVNYPVNGGLSTP